MRTRLWIALGVLVLGGIGGIMWASTSLLVLQAALPGSPQTMLASSAKGTPVELFVGRVIGMFAPLKVQELIKEQPVWAYGQEDGEDTVLAHNGSWIAGSLHPWRTVLSRDDSAAVTIHELGKLFETIAGIALGAASNTHPTVIIQLPEAPESLRLTGFMDGSIFRFTYSLSGLAPTNTQTRVTIPDATDHAESLKVALPSNVLELFPSDTRASVQNDIVSDLGFTKTLPDIIEQLEAGDTFGIDIEESSHTVRAIGIAHESGNEQFIGALDSWMALERAYIAPVRHAFGLPDGTTGYELIPSPNTTAGFSSVGIDGCQTSYIGSRQVWRCQSDESQVVAFGTSYDATRRVVFDLLDAYQNDHWRLEIPGRYARYIPSALGIENAPEIHKLVVGGQGDLVGQGYITF